MDLSGQLKQLVIISAGGFGRTIAGIARVDPAHGVAWRVAGFLDGRTALAAKSGLPILGDPATYQCRSDQYFACALGAPEKRRAYAAPLLSQGARFINIGTTRCGQGCTFGNGCLFEEDVKVGVDVRIGDFVLVQANTIIGYEVTLGDYCTVGSFVFIGGGAKIGKDAVIHPHSTILPGVKIGDGAVVGAGSVVIGNVPAGVTVMGNPAKRFRFK